MTEETKTIDQSKLIDHMKYLPGMEVIDSDMLDQVVAIRSSFNNDDFTDKDVRLALSKEHLDPRDFMASYRRPLHRSWKKWPRKPIWSRGAISATTSAS